MNIVQGEGYRLIQGDCLEGLSMLQKIRNAAVIMDPPYGIEHTTNYGASWGNKMIIGDESTSARDVVVKSLCKMPMAIFGSWKQSKPCNTRAVLVWDKGPAFGMGDLSFPWKMSWEEIYILGNGWRGYRDEGVLRGHLVVSWESMGRLHPHEKPVSLIKQIINKLPDVEVIIDPFVGSGSTGVAALQLGYEFIGYEIDPHYFAIAARRIADASRAARGLPKQLKDDRLHDDLPLFAGER